MMTPERVYLTKQSPVFQVDISTLVLHFNGVQDGVGADEL